MSSVLRNGSLRVAVEPDDARRPNMHAADLILNTLAFGTIIAIQQLVIMPSLSRLAGPEAFAQQVLFVTIATVAVNVTGVELGNVALARANRYALEQKSWDFGFLVPVLALSGAAILWALAVPLQSSPLDALSYGIVVALGVGRSFATACFRYRQRFAPVFGVSVGYGVGALIGLPFVLNNGFLSCPFLFAELAAMLVTLILRPWDGIKFCWPRRGSTLRESLALFVNLSLVAGLMNFVSYFDRVLALPLMGASALSVYYAASVLAKSVSVLTNPIASTLLSRLAVLPDSSRSWASARFLRILLPLCVLFAIVNVSVSLLGLKVLYFSYLAVAVDLVAPVGVAAALSSTSDLLKPLLIRFYDSRVILLTNMLYAGVFAASVFLFTLWWGLIGFAWSSVLGRVVQLGGYLALTLRSKQESGATTCAGGLQVIDPQEVDK